MALLDKYTKLVCDLLPRGLLWEKVSVKDSNLYKYCEATGCEGARVEIRGAELIREVDPRTTLELLTDWETTVGLPDECSVGDLTIADRRTLVLQRLTSRGGISAQDYIDIAAAFGVEAEIEIDSALPAYCGTARCGDRMYDLDWWFYFIVRSADFVVNWSRCGQASCGDRIRTFGNEPLECTIKKLKPAHTDVIFEFVT